MEHVHKFKRDAEHHINSYKLKQLDDLETKLKVPKVYIVHVLSQSSRSVCGHRIMF